MPPSYAELAAENARLRAQVAALTAQIEALSVQVARSNERLDELLAIAQRKKRKASTPRPPAPAPVVDPPTQAAFEARPLPPELPPRSKPPPKPKTGGRARVPEHLGIDEHVVPVEVCPGCGGRGFLALDEVVEEKITAVKEHVRRRRVVRKVGRCKGCHQRVTAPGLPAPYKRSKFTCEFLAWLIVQKFVLLVPLDRVRDLLALQGVRVAISVLVHLVQKCAELLGPIDGVHWKELLAGSWMATDATHLSVVVKGVPGTHRGHLEAFVRDDLVVMQYEPEKGSQTLLSKLAPFSGHLLADAEHRHNAVFVDGRVIEALRGSRAERTRSPQAGGRRGHPAHPGGRGGTVHLRDLRGGGRGPCAGADRRGPAGGPPTPPGPPVQGLPTMGAVCAPHAAPRRPPRGDPTVLRQPLGRPHALPGRARPAHRQLPL